MKIVDFLNASSIITRLVAKTKEQVIEEMVEHIAVLRPNISKSELSSTLLHRESLSSTAIGKDVAIPHAKLESTAEIFACLGYSAEGIDFGASDFSRTYLFFVLVAPQNSSGVHLKALARISRLCKNTDLRAQFSRASTASEMFEILIREDERLDLVR